MPNQSDFVAAYSQMFATMFKARYNDAGGVMRGKVEELHGLVGDAYKMKYMDKIQMRKHGAYNSNIPRTTTTVTAPSLTFEDYDLKSEIDEFEQKNFNADALRGYAKAHADALTRREDQFAFNAMSLDAGSTIAANGQNMNIAKIEESYETLVSNGVRGDEMFLIMHAKNFSSLMKETEFASSLFNAVKPLVNPSFGGDLGLFMGFNLVVVGDYGVDQEGNQMGLKLTSGIRETFAFARSAVTVGYSIDPETRMVPREDEARTVVLSLLRAGGKVGDPKGVIKIECDES